MMAGKYNYVGHLQPHYQYRILRVDKEKIRKLFEREDALLLDMNRLNMPNSWSCKVGGMLPNTRRRLLELNQFNGTIRCGILPVTYKNEPYGVFLGEVDMYIEGVRVMCEEYVHFTMNNGQSAIDYVNTATYEDIKTKLNICNIDSRLYERFLIYKELLNRNPWIIYPALPVEERRIYKNVIKTAIYFMNRLYKIPPELIDKFGHSYKIQPIF